VFAENVYGRSDPSDESPACQTKGLLKKKQPKTKYESKSKQRLFFFISIPVKNNSNY